MRQHLLHLLNAMMVVCAACLLTVSNAGAIQYDYDDLNRLIEVRYDDGARVSYTYDAAGNITEIVQTPSNKQPGERGGSGGGGASQPVLSLPSPGMIDLSTNLTAAAFPVTNKFGTGSLAWTIGEIQYSGDTAWITSVEPRSGTTSTQSIVRLTAGRDGLPPGAHVATVPVVSNGGDGSITVRIEGSPISPAPPCVADTDCDDGLFCNGAERCLDGVCTAGTTPCSGDQLCNEQTDSCWGTRKLAARTIRNSFTRPAVHDARRVWLIVRCTEKNHFHRDRSTITLSADGADGKGVSVDTARAPFTFWQFISVPLVIEKTATLGAWSVSIQTADEDGVYEIIECGLEVL
jgi:YD repeat-containing protein